MKLGRTLWRWHRANISSSMMFALFVNIHFSIVSLSFWSSTLQDGKKDSFPFTFITPLNSFVLSIVLFVRINGYGTIPRVRCVVKKSSMREQTIKFFQMFRQMFAVMNVPKKNVKICAKKCALNAQPSALWIHCQVRPYVRQLMSIFHGMK